MIETQEAPPNKEIVIAVFEGEHTAVKVLTDLEALGTSEVTSLRREGTIVTQDEQGKLSVTPPKTKAKGTTSGVIVGTIVGAVVGIPVAGILLGGVAGALGARIWSRRKLNELVSENVGLQHLTDSMSPNSSIIIGAVQDYMVASLIEALNSRGAIMVLHAPENELAETLSTGVGDNSEPES